MHVISNNSSLLVIHLDVERLGGTGESGGSHGHLELRTSSGRNLRLGWLEGKSQISLADWEAQAMTDHENCGIRGWKV